MSDYRDSLPPEQVPLYDECTAKAGRLLAEILARMQHDGQLPELPPVAGGQ